MPVRYDIAAQVPQASAGPDIMNMMAQYQAMGYRQQQNALAQMQLEQAQREMQQEQALAGLFGRPGFNPLTQQGLADIARVNPGYFRQFVTPYAGYQAERARERALTGSERRAEETQPYAIRKAEAEAGSEEAKLPGVRAETREKTAKAIGEEIKTAQKLLAPAFMARDPDAMAALYADAYSDLPETIRKRLGPRPDMTQITALFETPEQIAESRKPILKAPGQMVIQGTGRPGEFTETEPTYAPQNAFATGQPGLNTLAGQGRMPPAAGDMAPPVDPIIARQLKKQAQLQQLPPGPARETAGARMDLRDTLDTIDASATGLAESGGIPRAGATKAENWKAAFRKSPTGQALGNLSDSEVNAQLASLRTASAVLKGQMRKALEMGVTQMDAVKEAEKLDAAFLNPDKIKGLSEAYASIDVLRKLLTGGGEGPARAPTTRGRVGEEKPAERKRIKFMELSD